MHKTIGLYLDNLLKSLTLLFIFSCITGAVIVWRYMALNGIPGSVSDVISSPNLLFFVASLMFFALISLVCCFSSAPYFLYALRSGGFCSWSLKDESPKNAFVFNVAMVTLPSLFVNVIFVVMYFLDFFNLYFFLLMLVVLTVVMSLVFYFYMDDKFIYKGKGSDGDVDGLSNWLSVISDSKFLSALSLFAFVNCVSIVNVFFLYKLSGFLSQSDFPHQVLVVVAILIIGVWSGFVLHYKRIVHTVAMVFILMSALGFASIDKFSQSVMSKANIGGYVASFVVDGKICNYLMENGVKVGENSKFEKTKEYCVLKDAFVIASLPDRLVIQGSPSVPFSISRSQIYGSTNGNHLVK